LSNERVDLAASVGSKTLLTRDQGRALRESILARWTAGQLLTLDLSTAEAISPSFADEFFGGLESALGGAFRSSIRIVCPQAEWRSLISAALAHRREKAAS
jgi:hypothetical protein